jgi:hypothetical protein
MNEILDDGILALYILARQDVAAEATYLQKMAIEHLKDLAHTGNPDADSALNRLKHLPDFHPFLKEVLAA